MKSYNKIEYHTVGRNSTNFYDQEHNLVTMHIANQEDMQKVFKYFFEQGAKCMKDRHQGQRESFEDIYFKFNKMNYEEIDSKINPQKVIEVITIDDDANSNGDCSEVEEHEIICIDPSSPSYEYPTEEKEDSIDLTETTRKRKRNDSYSSVDTTGQLESEEISKRLAEIEDYYRELDDQLSKQHYTRVDTSIECDDDSDAEEQEWERSEVPNIDVSHLLYTNEQWND